MGAPSRPRFGSLQFYPRKRAAKIIPSVNWSAVSTKSPGLLGFIAYKVGMASAIVKDVTDKSMTQNKRIAVPVTLLEVPPMKVFSIRFYNKGIVSKEVIVSNDRELKKIVRVPKVLKSLDSEAPKEFQDVRVIAYSVPKTANIKKTPDIIEIAFNADNKLEFAKSLIGKELSLADFVKPDANLIDVRGLTKGHGLEGPVKRFGIGFRSHKAEKGQRNQGSLGPWHPARVTFRTPLAGQVGLFSRVHYNHKILFQGNTKENNINPNSGFHKYGKITSSYLVVKGSVQGPNARQILITAAMRPNKAQTKKKLEFVKLITP